MNNSVSVFLASVATAWLLFFVFVYCSRRKQAREEKELPLFDFRSIPDQRTKNAFKNDKTLTTTPKELFENDRVLSKIPPFPKGTFFGGTAHTSMYDTSDFAGLKDCKHFATMPQSFKCSDFWDLRGCKYLDAFGFNNANVNHVASQLTEETKHKVILESLDWSKWDGGKCLKNLPK